jgi:hypothetical protein
MRYLLLTYYTKASGQIDEVMTVAKKIKPRDWRTANVILDFKEQQVLTASVKGMTATRDWDTIVSYYYKHYAATIERMFEENGHPLNVLVDQRTTTEARPG